MVGSYVLLDVDFYFDPVKDRCYTGKLTSADPETDWFYVNLGNGPRLFASDFLFVFKERDIIYDYLKTNMKELGKRDLKDLFSICMLMDSELPEHHRKALEIASANPNIREQPLITLEDKLKQERSFHRGR